ncbi:MAG TPA: hypothetical protein DCK95_07670 [Anaerolineaceae bacterium]|nr:hypothetical protein [Anaerolineaceae bacterium]
MALVSNFYHYQSHSVNEPTKVHIQKTALMLYDNFYRSLKIQWSFSYKRVPLLIPSRQNQQILWVVLIYISNPVSLIYFL